MLKEAGTRRLKFMCLLAAPEGVAKVEREHPDVAVFTAAVDRELNERGYILPGLGDAGDRIYGTA
jgi:uracil phosphoribosyltransferase